MFPKGNFLKRIIAREKKQTVTPGLWFHFLKKEFSPGFCYQAKVVGFIKKLFFMCVCE